MSNLNYANLAARVAQANQNIEEGGNVLQEGDWNCIFVKGELTKSRNGNDMFKVIAKVKTNPLPHAMHNKEVVMRFVLNVEFQLDAFLNWISRTGFDGQLTKDSDWAKLFDMFEEARLPMTIRIKRDAKNPQYNKYTILETGRVSVHGATFTPQAVAGQVQGGATGPTAGFTVPSAPAQYTMPVNPGMPAMIQPVNPAIFTQPVDPNTQR